MYEETMIVASSEFSLRPQRVWNSEMTTEPTFK